MVSMLHANFYFYFFKISRVIQAMKGPNNFTYCTIGIWGFSMQVLQGLVGLMMNG
jgi:hypothetical protein